MGPLSCSCRWALPEALSLGRGLSLLSTHPVADPARQGGERAVAWPQAQESRGCSRALGRVGAGGAAGRRRVGVRPGQELWLLPSAAFLEGPVGAPPMASPLSWSLGPQPPSPGMGARFLGSHRHWCAAITSGQGPGRGPHKSSGQQPPPQPQPPVGTQLRPWRLPALQASASSLVP